MITRREMLAAAALGGGAVYLRGGSVSAAPAQATRTPVNFAVPPGACDCHIHVFGDRERFPFIPGRAYTPPGASVDEATAVHASLHTTRVVIVQPSVYGVDNGCTLDAVRRLGANARAVVVVDATTSAAAMDDMTRVGARGIRLNLETGGEPDVAQARQRFRAAVERARGRNWHVQVFARPQMIEAIHDELAASPVPVVVDHFGRAEGALGVSQPGFNALLKLVQGGAAYVKVSAPYLGSTAAPGYADMAPFARALVSANPARVLWGSDWPHPDAAQVPGRKATDIAPFLQVDDGLLFNQFAAWVPDPAVRKTILVDNPARLYGF